MLNVNKLEKVIELEEQLRAEYRGQLEEKAAEIDRYARQQSDLQATVDQQLATIRELSGKATVNQRAEQLNRELTNRAEKLQVEVADLKKRLKSLQKDLAEVREENRVLKQFDAAKMKKNLDANKRKLAEKTRANEALHKSLSKTRGENTELQRQVTALEAKLERPSNEGAEDEEAA